MRSEDWPKILTEQLESTGRFVWGERDCALWVSSIVEAMTGVDFLGDFRGQYKDRAGSLEALQEIGQGTLRATVIDRLGNEIHPNLAQRGDVVLVEYEGDEALGICIGQEAAVKTAYGWATVSKWLTAWRV